MPAISYLLVARNDGMEQRMETTIFLEGIMSVNPKPYIPLNPKP